MQKPNWEKYLFIVLLVILYSIVGGLAILSIVRSEESGSEAVVVENSLVDDISKCVNRTNFAPDNFERPIIVAEDTNIPLQADPLYGRELYDFYVDQIHEQHYPNVPTHLVRAVIETESRYNPNVRSSAGAVGLMQVIPKWHLHRAEKYHLNDLFDPYTNIIAGVDLLNELYETYGNWSSALYGYNHSWGYVDHVLALAEQIKGGGG